MRVAIAGKGGYDEKFLGEDAENRNVSGHDFSRAEKAQKNKGL